MNSYLIVVTTGFFSVLLQEGHCGQAADANGKGKGGVTENINSTDLTGGNSTGLPFDGQNSTYQLNETTIMPNTSGTFTRNSGGGNNKNTNSGSEDTGGDSATSELRGGDSTMSTPMGSNSTNGQVSRDWYVTQNGSMETIGTSGRIQPTGRSDTNDTTGYNTEPTPQSGSNVSQAQSGNNVSPAQSGNNVSSAQSGNIEPTSKSVNGNLTNMTDMTDIPITSIPAGLGNTVKTNNGQFTGLMDGMSTKEAETQKSRCYNINCSEPNTRSLSESCLGGVNLTEAAHCYSHQGCQIAAYTTEGSTTVTWWAECAIMECSKNSETWSNIKGGKKVKIHHCCETKPDSQSPCNAFGNIHSSGVALGIVDAWTIMLLVMIWNV